MTATGKILFVDPTVTANTEEYMPPNASDTAVDPVKNTGVGKNTGDANSNNPLNHG